MRDDRNPAFGEATHDAIAIEEQERARSLEDAERRVRSMREEMERLRSELSISEEVRLAHAANVMRLESEFISKGRALAEVTEQNKVLRFGMLSIREELKEFGGPGVLLLDQVKAAVSALRACEGRLEAVGSAGETILKRCTELQAMHAEVKEAGQRTMMALADAVEERDALREERMRFINANVELAETATNHELITAGRLCRILEEELDKDQAGYNLPEDLDLEGEYGKDLRACIDRVVARLKDGT